MTSLEGKQDKDATHPVGLPPWDKIPIPDAGNKIAFCSALEREVTKYLNRQDRWMPKTADDGKLAASLVPGLAMQTTNCFAVSGYSDPQDDKERLHWQQGWMSMAVDLEGKIRDKLNGVSCVARLRIVDMTVEKCLSRKLSFAQLEWTVAPIWNADLMTVPEYELKETMAVFEDVAAKMKASDGVTPVSINLLSTAKKTIVVALCHLYDKNRKMYDVILHDMEMTAGPGCRQADIVSKVRAVQQCRNKYVDLWLRELANRQTEHEWMRCVFADDDDRGWRVEKWTIYKPIERAT